MDVRAASSEQASTPPCLHVMRRKAFVASLPHLLGQYFAKQQAHSLDYLVDGMQQRRQPQ